MYQYEYQQSTSKTADGIAASIQNLLGTYLPSSDLSTVEECKDLQETETGESVAANAWKDNIIFKLHHNDLATWLQNQTEQVKAGLGETWDAMLVPSGIVGPAGEPNDTRLLAGALTPARPLALVV